MKANLNFSEYFLEMLVPAPQTGSWNRLALLAISGAGGGLHGTLAGGIAAVAALARRPKYRSGGNQCSMRRMLPSCARLRRRSAEAQHDGRGCYPKCHAERARAQQSAVPVMGFLGATSPGPYAAIVAAVPGRV